MSDWDEISGDRGGTLATLFTAPRDAFFRWMERHSENVHLNKRIQFPHSFSRTDFAARSFFLLNHLFGIKRLHVEIKHL